MAKVDLHLHSACSSDADFSPQTLLHMAKKEQMKMISIADHNSTRAYRDLSEADLTGIELICGVELDCTIEDVNLHVLGYGIDPHDARFEQIEQTILAQEKTAGLERIKKVQALKIAVDEKKVLAEARNGEIPGELIAEIALADPRNADCELLQPYRSGGSRSDNPNVNFYWDFCAPGKAAYVPIRFQTLAEAMNVIHETGGIAVLAHPGNNIHEDEALLAKILDSGVQGIEVYSSYHTPEQIEFYHQKAKAAECLITCGSDFHGKNKPKIKIGCPSPKESDEELMQALLDALAKQKAKAK